MLKLFSVILSLVCLINCSSISRMGVRKDLQRYVGAGQIELLVRPHGFGGETYGFALILPKISTKVSSHKRYRLLGLPAWRGPLNVELATSFPVFGQPIAESDRRALRIPDTHKISCLLVDGIADRELKRFQGYVNDLGGSRTLQFDGASFMRHLFFTDLEDISFAEDPILSVDYDVASIPIQGYLQIVLLFDAATKR